MIASKAAAQSVSYEAVDYDEFLQRIARVFSLDNDADEIAVSNAERLSPVAAAHRILTNSMSLLPIALRRRAGGEPLRELRGGRGETGSDRSRADGKLLRELRGGRGDTDRTAGAA